MFQDPPVLLKTPDAFESLLDKGVNGVDLKPIGLTIPPNETLTIPPNIPGPDA